MKEYDEHDNVKFEGEYLNGEKMVKVKNMICKENLDLKVII